MSLFLPLGSLSLSSFLMSLHVIILLAPFIIDAYMTFVDLFIHIVVFVGSVSFGSKRFRFSIKYENFLLLLMIGLTLIQFEAKICDTFEFVFCHFSYHCDIFHLFYCLLFVRFNYLVPLGLSVVGCLRIISYFKILNLSTVSCDLSLFS